MTAVEVDKEELERAMTLLLALLAREKFDPVTSLCALQLVAKDIETTSGISVNTVHFEFGGSIH